MRLYHFNFTILITALLFLSLTAQGQKTDVDYYTIKKEFEEQPEEFREVNNKHFKRWSYYTYPRVFPEGKQLRPDVLWQEWKQEKETRKNKVSGLPEWKPIGPNILPDSGGGAGRLNSITFLPGDPQTIFVGSPDGGLWKTTNGGGSWVPLTDDLPSLGVTDLKINPDNTDIMYMATGDGYAMAIYSDYDVWNGLYSIGVLKSADGGDTWDETGLNWDITQTRLVQKLLMDPDKPNTLFAATTNGIWKTIDGGATWNAVLSGSFMDLKYRPGSTDTIFAGGEQVYRSVDKGSTWTTITSSASEWSFSYGTRLAVSKANPDVIYALPDETGYWVSNLYKSIDGGETWTTINISSWITTYGVYTMALSVSPYDENEVYIGGVDVYKSTDGGNSFGQITDWYGWPANNYIHADNRYITYHPTDPNTIFAANDGGIFKSTNNGANWEDLSEGLQIMQFYKMGGAPSDPSKIFAGAQDNGVNFYNNGSWKQVVLADGMECVVNYSDEKIVYASTQNGRLSKSTNGGKNFFSLSNVPGADWVTPLEINPTNPDIIYAGGAQVYESSDGGYTWDPISSFVSQKVTVLKAAPSNGDILYSSTGSRWTNSNQVSVLYKKESLDWSDISPGLPVNNAMITEVAIDENDPDKVWVGFSGFQAGEKVYYSNDGGITWNNISGSLPNIPVNTIVHDHEDEYDGVYAGTDFGVYYRNDSIGEWILYSEALPNVIVAELEINYTAEKIRAATHGRGLWEAPLFGKTTGTGSPDFKSVVKVYPNPGFDQVYVESNGNGEIFLYDIMGKELMNKSITKKITKVDVKSLNSGIYILKVKGNSKMGITRLIIQR